MNRALLIILVPAVVVAAGYMVVFRMIGVMPAYGWTAAVGIIVCGGIWWLGRAKRKAATAERRDGPARMS